MTVIISCFLILTGMISIPIGVTVISISKDNIKDLLEENAVNVHYSDYQSALILRRIGVFIIIFAVLFIIIGFAIQIYKDKSKYDDNSLSYILFGGSLISVGITTIYFSNEIISLYAANDYLHVIYEQYSDFYRNTSAAKEIGIIVSLLGFLIMVIGTVILLNRKQDKTEKNKTIICQKCGASNDEKQRFCDKCGNNLEVQGYNSPEIKLVCSRCGTKIKESSEYCPFCGIKIQKEDMLNNK